MQHWHEAVIEPLLFSASLNCPALRLGLLERCNCRELLGLGGRLCFELQLTLAGRGTLPTSLAFALQSRRFGVSLGGTRSLLLRLRGGQHACAVRLVGHALRVVAAKIEHRTVWRQNDRRREQAIRQR